MATTLNDRYVSHREVLHNLGVFISSRGRATSPWRSLVGLSLAAGISVLFLGVWGPKLAVSEHDSEETELVSEPAQAATWLSSAGTIGELLVDQDDVGGASPLPSDYRLDTEEELLLYEKLTDSTRMLTDLPETVAGTFEARQLEILVFEADRLLSTSATTDTEVALLREDLHSAAAALEERAAALKRLHKDLDQIFGSGLGAVVVLAAGSGTTLVEYNPDLQFTAASTYKLFAAYSMFQAVNSGEWTWDQLLGEERLGDCLDAMIVESDNYCPEQWLQLYGRETLQQVATEFRLSRTEFAPMDYRTTAADMARTIRLLNGTDFLSQTDRDLLMDLMGVQLFREGIPVALESEGLVQDKVGFLDGNLHDVAMIRTEKGDFAMAIMTTGLSWEAVAEAASAVYDYL